MARSVESILRSAQQYLFYRDQEAAAKKAKERATEVLGDKKRNLLKEYIDEHGTPNGKDIDWYFPDALTIGDATYEGLRLQAKETQYFDEDRAAKLLEAKGLLNKVQVEVVTTEWDWDELYNLVTEGEITQEELDSLLETDTQYALVVIK